MGSAIVYQMIFRVMFKLLMPAVMVSAASVAPRHPPFEFRAYKCVRAFAAAHVSPTLATWQQETGAGLQSPPVPMPSPPPTPKLDFDAYPFECCTFREWRVTHKTQLFTTWRSSRTQVGWLWPNQAVVGLTGVHITFSPYKLRMVRAIPELDLQPGDIVLEYMYLGEGYAQFWFKGRYYPSEDLVGDDTLRLLQRGRREWWVQVRIKNGETGWALVNSNFEGMDACG